MKVMAINGGPRKTWNTATLLRKALEGAASVGAETELVHLYDLDFKGCVSCFACKTLGGASYGRCVVRDELRPVYERIESADALVLGSPVYLGTTTGEMRSFIERLVFPYLTYTDPPGSLFPRAIKTGLIYTMNVAEAMAAKVGYDKSFEATEWMMRMVFGSAESLCCYDTYQFDDYSKVLAERFDERAKRARRDEVFPVDCEKAFALGARLASKG